MKSIDYKVPNGKLLRIDFKLDDNIIKYIKIHGDFFIHPEVGIEVIEKTLLGANLSDEKLLELLKMKTKKIEMIGVSVEDIIQVLKNNC
jgi:lipoate---protein ligase